MTKLMKTIAVLAICLAGANARATPAATADDAAKQTMSKLPGLDAKALRKAGLPGAGDLRKSGLDAPLKVYLVGLDALRAHAGRELDPVPLVDLQQMLYPVVANGEVVSSLGVQKTAQGWETSEISSPEFAKLVVQVRSAAMVAEKRGAGAYSLVEIPALQMAFVAQGEGELTLRSVVAVPAIGLEANTPISGRELFAKLVPLAQSYQEDLP